MGVGAGVSPSAPFSSPAAGEGVTSEPMSSITAAKSLPSCDSIQDPVVQPAMNAVPLCPAAMAIALSSMLFNESPC